MQQPADTTRPPARVDHQALVLLYGQEHANTALAQELTLDGYQVRRASHPAMVPGRHAAAATELVIFARAARCGGLELLRSVRAGEFTPEVPATVRTLWMTPQASGLPDVLRAFDAGADDVLRAPFAYPERLARARALLRRDTTSRIIACGALRIDTTARHVTFAATPIQLRPMEYQLLVHLARDPTRVYTKHELLRDVWNYRTATTTTRTLDTHASRLRRKLTNAGATGWINTITAIGYQLTPPTTTHASATSPPPDTTPRPPGPARACRRAHVLPLLRFPPRR